VKPKGSIEANVQRQATLHLLTPSSFCFPAESPSFSPFSFHIFMKENKGIYLISNWPNEWIKDLQFFKTMSFFHHYKGSVEW
jgi:hypothetical protein